jgi:predicted nucleic acid-binding protein
MTFLQIPLGATVFLDANTLIYHFAPDPVFGPACSDLLVRIKRQEIYAYTSTHVLSEVAHRLMTIEATRVYGWPPAGITRRLRNHPAEVQKLTSFRHAIQETRLYGIQILTIAPDLIDGAAAISQLTGLLSNDALIVAVMQQHGLTNLASEDGDFDRVPGITRYGPV